MSVPNRQIGSSSESNLLWQIAKQLEKLIKVVANSPLEYLISLKLDKNFSSLPTASLPLSSSDTLVVNQSGVPKEVAVSEFGGSSKRSFTIEIPISQVLAASTSWWGRDTANQTIFNATFTQNANWTPTNDFANINVQRTSNLVPFDCKIKTVLLKGFSNLAATDVRFCVVKSKGQSGGAIANSKIIADKTINTAGNIFEFEFTGTDLDTATIVLKGSEIRLVFFNNNVASNLLSTILLIEFEEL